MGFQAGAGSAAMNAHRQTNTGSRKAALTSCSLYLPPAENGGGSVANRPASASAGDPASGLLGDHERRAVVLPLVIVGITLASTTRRPATPRTRRWLSSDRVRIVIARPCARCPPGERSWSRCARLRAPALRRSTNCAPGRCSSGEYARQRRLRDDAPRDAQRLRRDAPVFVRGQVVWRDARRIVRCSALRMRTLPRLVGIEIADARGECREAVDRLVVGAQRQWLHVVLQVGDAAARDRCARRRRAARAPCSSGPVRRSAYSSAMPRRPQKLAGHDVERAYAAAP